MRVDQDVPSPSELIDPEPALCGGSGELEESIGEGETVQSLCPGCPDCPDVELEV